MKLPRWIYPPRDYLPFVFRAPASTTLTLNVPLTVLSLTTINRWLRIVTIDPDGGPSTANDVYTVWYPGGSPNGALVQGISSNASENLVFIVLPPTTLFELVMMRLSGINAPVRPRIAGWYF